MDTQEKRTKRRNRAGSEADRGEKLAPPRRSRALRKARQILTYNPGQIRLMEELAIEFARHREVAVLPGGLDLTIRLADDIPHLEAFFDYKIRDLVSQQKRLARLWQLEAV